MLDLSTSLVARIQTLQLVCAAGAAAAAAAALLEGAPQPTGAVEESTRFPQQQQQQLLLLLHAHGFFCWCLPVLMKRTVTKSGAAAASEV